MMLVVRPHLVSLNPGHERKVMMKAAAALILLADYRESRAGSVLHFFLSHWERAG